MTRSAQPWLLSQSALLGAMVSGTEYTFMPAESGGIAKWVNQNTRLRVKSLSCSLVGYATAGNDVNFIVRVNRYPASYTEYRSIFGCHCWARRDAANDVSAMTSLALPLNVDLMPGEYLSVVKDVTGGTWTAGVLSGVIEVIQLDDDESEPLAEPVTLAQTMRGTLGIPGVPWI